MNVTMTSMQEWQHPESTRRLRACPGRVSFGNSMRISIGPSLASRRSVRLAIESASGVFDFFKADETFPATTQPLTPITTNLSLQTEI